MTHAALPGGWRTTTLMEAVTGDLTIDSALHLVGIRTNGDLKTKAEQDLTDAVTAWTTGDQPTAFRVVESLAEDIRRTRQPGRGAAA